MTGKRLPKSETKPVSLVIRLPAEMLADVDASAAAANVSRNAMIRVMISTYGAQTITHNPDPEVRLSPGVEWGERDIQIPGLGHHGPKDRDRRPQPPTGGSGVKPPPPLRIDVQFGPTKSKPGDRLKKDKR